MRMRGHQHRRLERRQTRPTSLTEVIDQWAYDDGLLDHTGIELAVIDDQVTIQCVIPALLSNRLLSSDAFRRHRNLQRRRRDGYLLDRAIIAADLYAADFDAIVEEDDHGEYLSAIYLKQDKIELIKSEIGVPGGDDTAIVRQALIGEYGHLLPLLDDKQFKVSEVDTTELYFGQTAHAENLDTIAVSDYAERLQAPLGAEAGALPQGVVIERRGRYRVLDGYHRLQAATDQGHGKVSVWEAY